MRPDRAARTARSTSAGAAPFTTYPEDKNRHGNKKFHRKWRYGYTDVAGVLDRESGRAAAKVIPDATRETLFPYAEEHVCPGGTLFSDNATVYRDGFGWPGRHETVNHKNEYVRGDVHTNGIESFWAKAKGTIRDTYRHVSPKYFSRYLKEIVGRHNFRGMALLDQMKLLVSGMMRKRLTYQDLLATEVPPVPYTHHRSGERAKLFE